jgi:hypothetical protein
MCFNCYKDWYNSSIASFHFPYLRLFLCASWSCFWDKPKFYNVGIMLLT